MTDNNNKPCSQFEGGGIKSMVLIKASDTIIDSEGRMYIFSDAEIINIPLQSDNDKTYDRN